MRYSVIVCTIVLIAVAGLADAAKRPPIPEHCRPNGACTAPAPACLEDHILFECEQATGTWVGTNLSLALTVDMTIGGPVRIEGDFSLINKANLTFNESRTAVLTIMGTANFTQANETWYLRIGDDDIKKMAEVEKSGSTDYSASARRVFFAEMAFLPEGWKLKLLPTTKCNVPSLISTTPAWFSDPEIHHPTSYTFEILAKTKSECWWWIVLVGVILIYFALLVLLIILFRTVPALKKWTARPSFETHGPSTPVRLAENEYEMDASHHTRSSRHENDSDDTDSVRLDL